MFCSSCGKAAPTNGQFCSYCGLPRTVSSRDVVPVAVVSSPPRPTSSQQGDHITAVAGRIGCNLLVGFIIFKVVGVVGLLVICVLLVWSLGIIK
jgi:hypothetical protein